MRVMRILIVGGGVAGLTLAAKLRQQGREPVVVEKAPEYADSGYAIGLYSLGSCVLHGLGVYREFLARGVEARRYEIADHTGEVLQALDMAVLTGSVGPMILLPRTDLIDLLRETCMGMNIRMGTTIERIDPKDDIVQVAFSDGTDAPFDLVVGCEGIHSRVRAEVFGEPEVFDCGWTIWTWWGPCRQFPADLVREYWGRGFFFACS